MQKVAKNSPSAHHCTTLLGYIFATKARIDNISPTCPYNVVNFGLLAAEIVSLVWGTPANFNGLHALTALLHSTLVVGVSQTAMLNRGRHLYSAVQPSCWALAHISSCCIVFTVLLMQCWIFVLKQMNWCQETVRISIVITAYPAMKDILKLFENLPCSWNLWEKTH